MDTLLDSASALKYRPGLDTSDLRMPAETRMADVSPVSIYRAKAAHEKMVALRHQRIAIVAYHAAQARGFGPGHDAEDWLRAQLKVNAQDAGISQP